MSRLQNLKPGELTAMMNRHVAARRYAESLRLTRSIPPSHICYIEALACSISVHIRLGQLAEARSLCETGLEKRPNSVSFNISYGWVLLASGEIDAAEQRWLGVYPLIEEHRTAGRMSANEAAAEKARVDFNLAMLYLGRGDFDKGWALYETRFEAHGMVRRAEFGETDLPPQFQRRTRWEGEPLAGKRIVVWSEQGLGDSLMFCRYIPALFKAGASEVIASVRPGLVKLLADSMPKVIVLDQVDLIDPNAYDYHVPICGLPYRLKLPQPAQAPRPPYLLLDKHVQRAWQARLSSVGGLKVGLCWSGGDGLHQNTLRSLSLARFAPLFAQTGISFFSLQKGAAAADLACSQARLIDLTADCHDLRDTAGLISQLDLVITVDTAMAHLAGAMGKPVWMLNRFASEWRWGMQGDSTPWYPSMRIFRQPKLYDWDSVLDAVGAALATQPRRARGAAQDLDEAGWTALLGRLRETPLDTGRKGFFARWFGKDEL